MLQRVGGQRVSQRTRHSDPAGRDCETDELGQDARANAGRQARDTGDLRGDLLHLLRRVRDVYREVGPDIVHGLLSEIQDMPKDAFEVAPAAVMTILMRAADRGEVRRERVTPLVAALPGNLIRNEVILVHGDASDTFLTDLVDEIVLPLVTTPAVRLRRPPASAVGSAGPGAVGQCGPWPQRVQE